MAHVVISPKTPTPAGTAAVLGADLAFINPGDTFEADNPNASLRLFMSASAASVITFQTVPPVVDSDLPAPSRISAAGFNYLVYGPFDVDTYGDVLRGSVAGAAILVFAFNVDYHYSPR
jgi:hypothetical protein